MNARFADHESPSAPRGLFYSASVAEKEFRERLIDGGVKLTAQLRPMPYGQDLAVVTSPQSMLAAWFKDAVEHDLIAMDDIPAPWRDRWFGTHATLRI